VLDIHSDAVHNRSVFTISATNDNLVNGVVALAKGCLAIDLSIHRGIHPRLGGLDVCPFVPLADDLEEAKDVAVRAAGAIADAADIPVYLYEAAAPEARSLPSLRKGGVDELIRRAREGFVPDFGPRDIDKRRGVVCVGARGPLIAFNVMLRADEVVAQSIAGRIRTSGGGPPGVRAYGWGLAQDKAQVSMNLTQPDVTGIDEVFQIVATEAIAFGASVEGTEIVGLPPARFMPDPQKETARLLIRPGRSLESVLAD
jgi:glutamate formiminotransferase / 5-formyltetrahydrofolate cyclo-ligase